MEIKVIINMKKEKPHWNGWNTHKYHKPVNWQISEDRVPLNMFPRNPLSHDYINNTKIVKLLTQNIYKLQLHSIANCNEKHVVAVNVNDTNKLLKKTHRYCNTSFQ